MLSYARGPDAKLLERTIGQQLECIAGRFPHKVAVVSCHQERRLTWAELLRQADCVARACATSELAKANGSAFGPLTASNGRWFILLVRAPGSF